MEINDLLQEVKLSEQVLMIAGRYAGRDMQNNINGDKIEQASGQLCTDVVDLVEKNVTGLDKILSYTPLNFIMLKHCYLQINEYDRIDVYYKDNKIGSTRFNYTLSTINKESLNKVFRNAGMQGTDICICLRNDKEDTVRFEIYKNWNLSEAYKKISKKYDENLYTKDKQEYIIDAMIIKFPFNAYIGK